LATSGTKASRFGLAGLCRPVQNLASLEVSDVKQWTSLIYLNHVACRLAKRPPLP
jgi:hypothetical protein